MVLDILRGMKARRSVCDPRPRQLRSMMHNLTGESPVRKPLVVSLADPPVSLENYAPLPHPIPLVIGILVGTQVVILVSVLVYLLRCKDREKSSTVYGEIGRSPCFPSGSRLLKRLKDKLTPRGDNSDSFARKNAKYDIQDAKFLERWRQKKRDMAEPQHLRTMSSPIEFTIPMKTEALVRPEASHGKVGAFPLPPMSKPSVEPWMSPERRVRSRTTCRAPVLTSSMRSKSLQTEQEKRGDAPLPSTRMSRSYSMPVDLNQAAMQAAAAREGNKSSPCKTAIGQIEPDLYRIDEQIELYTPSKFGLGKLSFSLFYDSREGQLTVYLIQAVQLPARTERATADSFVNVSLLPDEDEKRSVTSKVQRRTVNPIYRQNFIFRLPEYDVADTVVKLTVVALDRYSHPIHIGQVVYPLRAHDFGSSASDVSEPIWRDIEKSDSPEEPLKQGDILFSLTYLPNAERVTVVIIKARNLRLPEPEEPDAKKLVMDTFVKVTLVRGEKVVKNKQTSVVRRNANPTFNEAFTIDMTCENEQVCIVFAVCLRVNPFAGHKTLGRCLVGPDSKATGDGAAHWRDMMATPRCAVAEWHPLK